MTKPDITPERPQHHPGGEAVKNETFESASIDMLARSECLTCAAITAERDEALRKLGAAEQAARAWNALMTGLAAVDELDHDENVEKYKAIDSYIKAWEKQKQRADAAEATLRTCCENEDAARLTAAKILGDKAQGDSYCVPSVADLMEAVVERVEAAEAKYKILDTLHGEIAEALESRGCVHVCNGEGIGKICDSLETAEAQVAQLQAKLAAAEAKLIRHEKD